MLPWVLVLAITLCGTGPANDARVRAVHERTRARIAALGEGPSRAAALREGAFYLQNDPTITFGYRPFDLAGQSLVFSPAGDGAFSMKRTALQYTEPQGAPVRDFQADASASFVAHDLPFAVPLFGKSVSRIYVSAFNGITTDVPPVEGQTHFDATEAAVHRGALLSPLMMTAAKPRQLELPRVWIRNAPDAVIVTWRSSANAPFGYDLQAKIAKDGKVTYSYRDVTAIRWGTPVLVAGFDPAQVQRTLLRGVTDLEHDLPGSIPQTVRPMLDVRNVDAYRIASSDIYSVRITLNAPIDKTKLADGEVLSYTATVAGDDATVEIGRNFTRVRSFSSMRFADDGAAANVDGATIEFYNVQSFDTDVSARVRTSYETSSDTKSGDNTSFGIPFAAAPRTVTRDLSTVAEDTPLQLPIAEPFLLGTLDPVRVWELVRESYGVSTYDWDAIAIYQSFYTDIIWYAGAYATRGNAQVDGIAPRSQGIDLENSRAPTLLHMNQLTYNYSAEAPRAGQVMLHEFGHRWLYHFQIVEDGQKKYALNPVSSHPAAYVHTASAFPVYGESESSVMGGGYFTPQTDGSYKAHAANYGYSWTDLYLMGLATPDEVPPWFYVGGTDLPREYWPAEGAIANGVRHDVEVGQIIAAHGPRIPSAALSQRQFRVLFVLVTEEGTEATDAEVAKVNEWRALMERNFALATGGRGKLITTFARPGKRRAN